MLPEPTVTPSSKRADPDTLHRVYSRLLRELPWPIEAQRELGRRGLSPEQIGIHLARLLYAWLDRGGRARTAAKLIDIFGEATIAGVPGFVVREHNGRRYWTIGGPAGLLMPVRDVQGRIIAAMVRVAGEVTGGKYRYLTSKKRRDGGAGPGSPIHVPLQNGERAVIRVTEGVLKADLATIASRVPAVGLPGVASWPRAGAVLRELGVSDVLVAFDADWRTNPVVAKAMESLIYDLGEKGFAVAMETWDAADGKGIDDLLLRGKTPEVVAGAAVHELLKQIAERARPSAPETASKPDVYLPGNSVSVSDAAAKLGELLCATGNYFRRGNAVVKLEREDKGEPILRAVTPAFLASEFETVARLKRWKNTNDGPAPIPGTCTEQSANLILNSDAFLKALPPIRLLSRCPVLVERAGELMQVVGYDRDSGVLAFGEPLPEVSLDEAKAMLRELIADFRFASDSDCSRAFAAMMTPALIHGGLLGGRAPVDLGEADQSQTGKGFRNKITAALYRQAIGAVTQTKGGVGSLEEKFNTKLIAGANFISLDNVRGKLDSPAIESFLTEDEYSARAPYAAAVTIDPRRIVVMLTSNKAEITRDFANRSSCVRIQKQEPGYQFTSYPEGGILEHLEMHQPQFLAAVFAIVREWHRQGKPRSKETRHDFRRWAQTLDWIVQNIFGAAPLLDGHDATRERTTNPTLNWLRDVALIVFREHKSGAVLRAHDLIDLLADSDVEIPGITADSDLEDEDTRSAVLRALGRKLGHCFRGGPKIEIDNMTVEKLGFADEGATAVGVSVLKPATPDYPDYSRLRPDYIRLDSRLPRGSSEQSVHGEGARQNTDMGMSDACGVVGDSRGAPEICTRCEDRLDPDGACRTCKDW